MYFVRGVKYLRYCLQADKKNKVKTVRHVFLAEGIFIDEESEIKQVAFHEQDTPHVS